MRLNKYISETGVCSRREADKWIEAGRVTLNGLAAGLGTQVSDRDENRSTSLSTSPSASFAPPRNTLRTTSSITLDFRNEFSRSADWTGNRKD
jgi:16S rRNA U516 pseudouridylate synthase RsuA-like enzyme